MINNRTLVAVRWITVTGQALAVLTTTLVFQIPLPVIPLFTLIFAAAALNLFSFWTHGWALRPRTALVYLVIDLLQLAALLFLTGGLSNPFIWMLLIPVTVSASLLSLRFLIIITSLYLIVVTLLKFYHLPLVWPQEGARLPDLFIWGEWIALMLTGVFLSGYLWRAAEDSRLITRALQDVQHSLAEQKELNALGSLAAAAAHELGSPLSTITLIAHDLKSRLETENSDDTQDDIQEDLQTLIEQSERCKTILTDLSKEPSQSAPDMIEVMPLAVQVSVLSAPYQDRHPDISLHMDETLKNRDMRKTPSLSFGLGNILQNAFQYAESRIDISLHENHNTFSLKIADDGPGFSETVLLRLGQPYFSTRRNSAGHMGLGVFIARVLLEETGADLKFYNASPRGGAVVEIIWPKSVANSAF